MILDSFFQYYEWKLPFILKIVLFPLLIVMLIIEGILRFILYIGVTVVTSIFPTSISSREYERINSSSRNREEGLAQEIEEGDDGSDFLYDIMVSPYHDHYDRELRKQQAGVGKLRKLRGKYIK